MILKIPPQKIAFVIFPKCACTYLKNIYLNILKDNYSHNPNYNYFETIINKRIFRGIENELIDKKFVYFKY